MRLMEVDEAANHIRELVDPDANIIWGSAFNENLNGKIRVSVVATGIDNEGLNTAPRSATSRLSPSAACEPAAAPAPVAAAPHLCSRHSPDTAEAVGLQKRPSSEFAR